MSKFKSFLATSDGSEMRAFVENELDGMLIKVRDMVETGEVVPLNLDSALATNIARKCILGEIIHTYRYIRLVLAWRGRKVRYCRKLAKISKKGLKVGINLAVNHVYDTFAMPNSEVIEEK